MKLNVLVMNQCSPSVNIQFLILSENARMENFACNYNVQMVIFKNNLF